VSFNKSPGKYTGHIFAFEDKIGQFGGYAQVPGLFAKSMEEEEGAPPIQLIQMACTSDT
tara:strand:- start:74 stop:250 length:177 start_codon:yes stop_codon:yes gene_type:complete